MIQGMKVSLMSLPSFVIVLFYYLLCLSNYYKLISLRLIKSTVHRILRNNRLYRAIYQKQFRETLVLKHNDIYLLQIIAVNNCE